MQQVLLFDSTNHYNASECQVVLGIISAVNLDNRGEMWHIVWERTLSVRTLRLKYAQILLKVVGIVILLPESEFGIYHWSEPGFGIPEVGFNRILEFGFLKYSSYQLQKMFIVCAKFDLQLPLPWLFVRILQILAVAEEKMLIWG